MASPIPYAIESIIEAGKPEYKCIYIYKSATKFDYDSDGNVIHCGKMTFRLDDYGIINISNVKCNCPILKGKCFQNMLNILINEACFNTELFDKQLSINTKVQLFIFPSDIPDGISFEEATQKLYKLYSKYGFGIEDKEQSTFLVSTLRDIKSNIDGMPYYTPPSHSSPSPTPSRPHKPNGIKNRVSKKNLQKIRRPIYLIESIIESRNDITPRINKTPPPSRRKTSRSPPQRPNKTPSNKTAIHKP